MPGNTKPDLYENQLDGPGCQQSVTLCRTTSLITDFTCSAFDKPKVALRPTRLFSLEGLLQFSSQRLPVKNFTRSNNLIISFPNDQDQVLKHVTINRGYQSVPIHTKFTKCFYTTHQSVDNPSEIYIRLFRMSVTRLIGKGRSESMRPLTASFGSLWLTSELLQMTFASLTIRMMTAHTLKLQQQQTFPSSLR